MRRRSRRKPQPQPQPQKQKQPVSTVDSCEQASAACDSSSSSVLPRYFFPLFYFLLFSCVAFLALSPAVSHYAGSHPRSVPWLSGVHADVNNGEQGVVQNASAVYTHRVVLPMNGSTSASAQRLSQDTNTTPIPEQDFLSSHPSFQDFAFSIVFPASCPITSYDEDKDFCSWDSPRSLNSDYKDESTEQRSASLSDVNQGTKTLCVSQDHLGGVVDDGSQEPLITSNHLEGHDSHEDIHEDRPVDHHKQANSDMTDHPEKNEKNQSFESLKNHSDTGSPCNITREEEKPTPLDLSDIVNKTHPSLTNLSRIHLRQEPGDGPYNYASDSKGAKILTNNKEAKGATNILNKDKDKYFRTPCNVETKYVEMELSEETLVIEIAIANHEFYSSNVRDFALWGSLTYPTAEWRLLGKFEAENLRVSQNFRLQDPQWVRYLKLQMLSHYGSDFYCTLSVVEVFGVDAIEWLLEDWIAEESGLGRQPSFSKEGKQSTSFQGENSSIADKLVLPAAPERKVPDKDVNAEEELESILNQNLDENISENPGDGKSAEKSQAGKGSDKSQPVYHQTGRPALDTVTKLLMQKVRTLEQKQPLLARSLEEMEARYREVVGTHNNETAIMLKKLENMATELANLNALLHFMEGEWTRERHNLEANVLDQFKTWNANFELLRHELRRTEDKELVALAVSVFSLFTVVGVQVLMMCLPVIKPAKQQATLLLSCTKMLWTVPVIGCIVVTIVLSV